MTCELCKRQIEHYQPQFHRLSLENGSNVDICPSYIDAFGTWQLRTSVDLFSTKAAKRHFKKT